MTKLRECLWCGKTFFPNPSHKIYCCTRCRQFAYYYRDLGHTHANQRRRYQKMQARKKAQLADGEVSR